MQKMANHTLNLEIQVQLKLKENYHKWKIYPKPSIKELYPNMNIKTGPWVKEKKRLAEEIKEITLVWNISYEERCELLKKDIYCWDDPRLLGLLKESKKTLQSVISKFFIISCLNVTILESNNIVILSNYISISYNRLILFNIFK